jgi:SAM-dependent methyltransferase
MSRREQHWQQSWRSNPSGKSWVQQRPDLSLDLIARCQLDKQAAILDMGGGASTLVDFLLADGYGNITVADISAQALQLAQARLGDKVGRVSWIHADACTWQPPQKYQLWHDRAVFHFLIEPKDRAAYKKRLYAAVPVGGFLVMATFALGGPQKCSGLPIQQYDDASMAAEIGAGFTLLEAQTESHLTPGGASQKFQYCRFQRI